jgi:hypothetical protein
MQKGENMQKRLQGPQLVTVSIRPPRVALIVENIQHCHAVTEISSLTWGGRHFLTIPYKSEIGIAEEWWRLLSLYDPDNVVSYTALDDLTHTRLVELIKARPLSKDSVVKHKIDVIDKLFPYGDVIQGQSLYTAFAGENIRKEDSYIRPVFAPDTPSDHPLSLYIKAKYGALNETDIKSIQSKGDLRDDVTLETFVEMDRTSIADNYIAYLENNPTNHVVPIIDCTLTGLDQWVRRSFEENAIERVEHILVVSESLSIDDFCWFWNVRSQMLLPSDGLIAWLPVDLVQAETQRISRLLPPQHRAFILSTTLSLEKLQVIAQQLGTHVEARTQNLEDFYNGSYYVGVQNKQEAIFSNGLARISVPHVNAVKYGRGQSHYVDVQIHDYQLPKLNVHRWGTSLYTHYRVSKTGLSTLRFNGDRPERYIEIRVPSPLEILETCADIAGYTLGISDKGNIGDQVTRMIGGEDQLWFLTGKTVYGLIDQLSELSQAKEFKTRLRERLNEIIGHDADNAIKQIMHMIATDRHDRVQQTYDAMRRALKWSDQAAVTTFIKWLIHKNILFRGTEITCPVCRTKQWFLIDDLESQVRCHGCRQFVDVPLGINVTQWTYRINTLVAKAQELGLMPHLLTLSYYINALGYGRSSFGLEKITGCFPGIKLLAKQGEQVPFNEIEIDVAFIRNGQLVIGECKTHGRELSEQEVVRYITLAVRMKCAGIVFSALDNFLELDLSTQQLASESPIPVTFLTGDELFDQYPSKIIYLEGTEGVVQAPTEPFDKIVAWYLADWEQQLHLLQ